MGNDVAKASAVMKANKMFSKATGVVNEAVGLDEPIENKRNLSNDIEKIQQKNKRNVELKKEYQQKKKEREKAKASLTQKWADNRRNRMSK
mmetsp:Transcript_12451/g.24816  ORF Transcript_12451/g.24816 Transcript_12451/m.24816 type:complete len:91 (-) Transcript_12451:272-544(-)